MYIAGNCHDESGDAQLIRRSNVSEKLGEDTKLPALTCAEIGAVFAGSSRASHAMVRTGDSTLLLES
jgi:hypothetical protein